MISVQVQNGTCYIGESIVTFDEDAVMCGGYVREFVEECRNKNYCERRFFMVQERADFFQVKDVDTGEVIHWEFYTESCARLFKLAEDNMTEAADESSLLNFLYTEVACG